MTVHVYRSQLAIQSFLLRCALQTHLNTFRQFQCITCQDDAEGDGPLCMMSYRHLVVPSTRRHLGVPSTRRTVNSSYRQLVVPSTRRTVTSAYRQLGTVFPPTPAAMYYVHAPAPAVHQCTVTYRISNKSSCCRLGRTWRAHALVLYGRLEEARRILPLVVGVGVGVGRSRTQTSST